MLQHSRNLLSQLCQRASGVDPNSHLRLEAQPALETHSKSTKLQNITNQLQSQFSSMLELHYSHITKKEPIKSSPTTTEKKKQVEAYTSPGVLQTLGVLQQLEEIAVQEFYSRKNSVDHVVQN